MVDGATSPGDVTEDRKKMLPTAEQSDDPKSSVSLPKSWMLSVWKTGYLRQMTGPRSFAHHLSGRSKAEK